jgi:uncharacterized protein (TIGR00369 family)
MDWNTHYKKLENMYLSAPIQEFYKGSTIHIRKDISTIEMEISKDFFHAAQAMHGSVYFRMLDDAAYFAVSSGVKDVFIVTTSFNIQLYRPAASGKIKAEGKVLSRGGQLFHAEASLTDAKGRLLAHGTGSFAKSRNPLEGTEGYHL